MEGKRIPVPIALLLHAAGYSSCACLLQPRHRVIYIGEYRAVKAMYRC